MSASDPKCDIGSLICERRSGRVVTMNTLVEILFLTLVEFIGYGVARLLLPMLSFGRMTVQPLGASSADFNMFGVRRVRGGRLEVRSGVAGFFGLIIVVLAAVVLIRSFS